MKETIIPFYYEIRFRALKYKDNNNIEIETFKREFKNTNPLIAREEVFNEFNEYLSFIHSERIVNDNGNYKFIKPVSIQNLINKIESNDNEAFFKEFNRFQEDISIYLVISDNDLVKDIQGFHENSNEISVKDSQKNEKLTIELAELNASLGLSKSIENEFLIHKVSSSLSTDEEQEMIDNLEFTELKLYKNYNIDTTNYETVVVHYGLDFCESGEDEDECKWTILETPHVWSSKERYDIEFAANVNSQTETENPHFFTWEKMIEEGEGDQIEFKPALRYHFKHMKETNLVRKIIAKSICSLLNSKGGCLFIGVTDRGHIQGLEKSDYLLFEDNTRDKFRNEFDNLLYYFFTHSIKPFVKLQIEKIQGKDIGIVVVEKSNRPVFLKSNNCGEIQKEFYMRGEASSRQIIDVEEIIQYVFNNWKNC